MQPSAAFAQKIIHQFPQIDRSFVPVSYSRRFRKILPKWDPSISNTADIPPTVLDPDLHDVSLNPYVVIIPRVDNNPVPNNARLARVFKRRAVLKITINKMYNAGDSERNLKTEGFGGDPGREELVEEVEIRNYKLNRAVVFSLDPNTGEILVTKRTIDSKEENFRENVGVEDSRGITSHETTEEFEDSGPEPNLIRVKRRK